MKCHCKLILCFLSFWHIKTYPDNLIKNKLSGKGVKLICRNKSRTRTISLWVQPNKWRCHTISFFHTATKNKASRSLWVNQSAQSCKNTGKSLNVTPSGFDLVILEVQPLAELKSWLKYTKMYRFCERLWELSRIWKPIQPRQETQNQYKLQCAQNTCTYGSHSWIS